MQQDFNLDLNSSARSAAKRWLGQYVLTYPHHLRGYPGPLIACWSISKPGSSDGSFFVALAS